MVEVYYKTKKEDRSCGVLFVGMTWLQFSGRSNIGAAQSKPLNIQPHVGMDSWGLPVQGSSRRPDKVIVFIGEATAELLWAPVGSSTLIPKPSGLATAQCGPEQNQNENKKTTKWQRWSIGRRLGWGKSKRGTRDVCDENISNTCMRLSNDKF